MYIKVHILPDFLVKCEESIIVAVIGNSELAIYFLQRQNIGDISLIKLYLTISLYIGFYDGLNGSTIPSYCHGLIYCPDSCGKSLVTQEVNIGLIIQ